MLNVMGQSYIVSQLDNTQCPHVQRVALDEQKQPIVYQIEFGPGEGGPTDAC